VFDYGVSNLWEFDRATLAARFRSATPPTQFICNVRHPLGGYLHVFPPGTVLEEEFYFANRNIFGGHFPYSDAVEPDVHT
jgi:hypothetical protein